MSSNINQEDAMARTGATEKPTDAEPVVDFMVDAPPARPYGDAITDQHRALLAENGVTVPEAGAAA
jgi:hypothetical protein